MVNIKGGKAINSGGYGCIFKPALKCDDNHARSNGISKLMTKHHASIEYDIIERFIKVIKRIPNYRDYFLVDDTSLCVPDKLTKSDLTHFNRTCSSLVKDNVTSSNINKKLASLNVLNLPDAGIDFDHFILTLPLSSNNMQNINEHMIDLLEHAVVPMNKLHILHMDLKGSNLMIDSSEKTFKIIDWGLADIYDGINIPIVATNRPIQYNAPFSSILFNDDFYTIYSEFLQREPDILNRSDQNDKELNQFIINYYFYWKTNRGEGHHVYIQSVMRSIYAGKLNKYITIDDLPKLTDYFFYNSILNYIAPILRKYTQDNKFNATLYFKEVYSKNVDIWGVLISYEPLLRIIDMQADISPYNKNAMFAFISDLITQFLFNDSAEPIDVNSVIDYIKNFNNLLVNSSTTSNASMRKESSHITSVRSSHIASVISNMSPTKSLHISPDITTIKKLSLKPRIYDVVGTMSTDTPATKSNHNPTAKRKRCKKGTNWNKKTKSCLPKSKTNKQKLAVKKKIYDVFGTVSTDTPFKLSAPSPTHSSQSKKYKRCPTGTRRNPKTKKCESKFHPKMPSKLYSNPLARSEKIPTDIRQLFMNK